MEKNLRVTKRLWRVKRSKSDRMQDEIKSMHDNHTCDLVKLFNGKKVVENRWIYKIKKCVDFNEIFSLVGKMSSIRIVLSLVATFELEVEQVDVKITLLHGDLEEEIYMK
ncbi:hypothetical protein CR513_18796, partial [Mucuna pruriens]